MRSFRGLSLVDVIVGTALVLVVFVGLFGILRAALQISGLAKLRAAATSVASAQMEYVRSLPYASVGTVAGIPAGSIPQYASSTNGGLVFDVRTYVEYADDPADGTDAADTNGITADYKRAKVVVSYRVDTVTRDITLVTTIAPKGIESTTGGGTLVTSVVDAIGTVVPGATVRIENSATVPTIDVSTFTDAYGLVNLPGAPTSTEYRITVSKNEYSTATTYARDATNANPTPGYLTVIEGSTTTGTFAIDRLATLVLRTFSPIAPGSWSDPLDDADEIYAITNTAVAGGTLTLVGTPPYPISGSALSTTSAPARLSAWTEASAVVLAPLGTSALFQVADASGTPLPDAVLPANSLGFPSTVDLSGVSTTTYPALRLVAALSTTDTSVAPAILEWGIAYTAGPHPLPDVSVTLTGAKTIGSMTDGTPLYKTTVATTTNAFGVRSLLLEWDSYNLSVPGYTVVSGDPVAPYDLLPNTTIDASLYPYSMMHRGISLAESVVVIAITAMVAGALLSAIRYFYLNNAYVFEATSSVYQARRGLSNALADLREASYADDGTYPIGTAATSSITFYSDVDADGGVERVKIWKVGTNLHKVVTSAGGSPPTYVGQSSATSTIATYLRNATSTPIFTFYDASGAQLATTSPVISQIAAVGINIQIDLNPNRAPQIFTLTGKATLRNLKDQ